MKTHLLTIVTMIALATACEETGSPEDCELGVVADTDAFEAAFDSMELIDDETGESFEETADGFIVPEGTVVSISATAVDTTDWRACQQERVGGGDIVLDEEWTQEAGEESFLLGEFPPLDYVVRVGVDGVLVKNLPFTVE